MNSGVLVGLSALVCQILAQANVPAVQDFDAQKFSGQWYLIAMVMDEAVIEDAEIVNVMAAPIGSRDVLLNIVILQNDFCRLEQVHLMQTQQPGVFKVTGITAPHNCTAANQHGYPFATGCDITVHMVEVDYDSHYILHFTTMNNRILHLYTRAKKQLRLQKKIFRKAAKSLRFDLNKIIFESRRVKCATVQDKDIWKSYPLS